MNEAKGLPKFMIHAAFIIFCLFCATPLVIVISASLTDELAIVRNGFGIYPENFSTKAYEFIFNQGKALYQAYGVTILVTAAGTLLSIAMISLTGYTLSRKSFKYRSQLSFYIYFTMLFSGGMIPSYILVTKYLNMGDTIWVLFVPMLISPWYIFLMRRFMSDIPEALTESAKIDGASEYRIFLNIILPMSKPAVAALSLMLALGYWNNWWLSLLYIENDKLSSLQYLLYRIMSNVQAMQEAQTNQISISQGQSLPEMSLRMAMCVLAAGPALFVFPFFQKYFVKGLAVGAVKE